MWKKIITINDNNVDNNQDERKSKPNVDTGNSLQTSKPANSRKRKSNAWIVPRLISNKQKQLERNLLVVQRDQLFTNKLKNKAEFRK